MTNSSPAHAHLLAAAARFFFDPAPFLNAFADNPHATILTLRDDPARFGQVRSYVGKSATAAAHTKLLSAARTAWKIQDPAAPVRSTCRTRAPGKP